MSRLARDIANFGSVIEEGEVIRVLLVGDVGVGKSTFIQSYIEDSFVDNKVPAVIDPIQCISRLGNIEFHDSGEELAQSAEVIHEKIATVKPHLVALCFVAEDAYVTQRLDEYWLPALQASGSNVRVMLLALKHDTGLPSPGPSSSEASEEGDMASHTTQFAAIINKYMRKYECVAVGFWANAGTSSNSVSEAVTGMAYTVCFPSHPLFEEDAYVPTSAFQRAVARIFRCFDGDHDGIIRPADIALQQYQVFGLRLSDSMHVEPIIDAVALRNADGVATNPKGLYENGFCTMHTEHVLDGHADPVWAVLRCFHYRYKYRLNGADPHSQLTSGKDSKDCNELALEVPAEYLTYPVPLHADQTLTLSPSGRAFLIDVFNLYADNINHLETDPLIARRLAGQNPTTNSVAILTPSGLDRVFCTVKSTGYQPSGGLDPAQVSNSQSDDTEYERLGELADSAIYGNRGHPFGEDFPWSVTHVLLTPQAAQGDHIQAMEVAHQYDTGYAYHAGYMQRLADKAKETVDRTQSRKNLLQRRIDELKTGAPGVNPATPTDAVDDESDVSWYESIQSCDLPELEQMYNKAESELQTAQENEERMEHQAELAANGLPIRRWALRLDDWLGAWELLVCTRPAVALKCMYQLGFATAVPKESLTNAIEDLQSFQSKAAALRANSDMQSLVTKQNNGKDFNGAKFPGIIRMGEYFNGHEMSNSAAPQVGPLSSDQILALSLNHEYMPRLTLNPAPAFAPSIRRKTQSLLTLASLASNAAGVRGARSTTTDVFGGASTTGNTSGVTSDQQKSQAQELTNKNNGVAASRWLGLIGTFGYSHGHLPPVGCGPMRRIFVVGSKGSGKTDLIMHALHTREILTRYDAHTQQFTDRESLQNSSMEPQSIASNSHPKQQHHFVMRSPEIEEEKEREASKSIGQQWQQRRLELALYPENLIITEWSAESLDDAMANASTQCDAFIVLVDPDSESSREYMQSALVAIPDGVPTVVVTSVRNDPLFGKTNVTEADKKTDSHAGLEQIASICDQYQLERFSFIARGNGATSRKAMLRDFWKYVAHLSLHSSWDNPMTDERRMRREKQRLMALVRSGSIAIVAAAGAVAGGYMLYKYRDSLRANLRHLLQKVTQLGSRFHVQNSKLVALESGNHMTSTSTNLDSHSVNTTLSSTNADGR